MLWILLILVGAFILVKTIFKNNQRLRERRNKDTMFNKRRFRR